MNKYLKISTPSPKLDLILTQRAQGKMPPKTADFLVGRKRENAKLFWFISTKRTWSHHCSLIIVSM